MKSICLKRIGVGFLALLTLIGIGSSSASLAQGLEDDLKDLMQLSASDIRGMSVNIVKGVMDFTEEEGDAFWPVYQNYESEYGEIFDQMQAVIEDYKTHRDTMDDKKAKELAESVFNLDEKKVLLIKKYYVEFCRVITPKRATQLLQVLRRIDLLVNLKIAATLPIIGEDW